MRRTGTATASGGGEGGAGRDVADAQLRKARFAGRRLRRQGAEALRGLGQAPWGKQALHGGDEGRPLKAEGEAVPLPLQI